MPSKDLDALPLAQVTIRESCFTPQSSAVINNLVAIFHISRLLGNDPLVAATSSTNA